MLNICHGASLPQTWRYHRSVVVFVVTRCCLCCCRSTLVDRLGNRSTVLALCGSAPCCMGSHPLHLRGSEMVFSASMSPLPPHPSSTDASTDLDPRTSHKFCCNPKAKHVLTARLQNSTSSCCGKRQRKKDAVRHLVHCGRSSLSYRCLEIFCSWHQRIRFNEREEKEISGGKKENRRSSVEELEVRGERAQEMEREKREKRGMYHCCSSVGHDGVPLCPTSGMMASHHAQRDDAGNKLLVTFIACARKQREGEHHHGGISVLLVLVLSSLVVVSISPPACQ